KIAMYSVDFEPIEQLQHAGDWPGAAAILCDAAQRVEAAGADCLLICTNTMHKVAADIQQVISIPVLHIADSTAEVLITQGIKRVGLLGTAFTMEQDFYKGRLMSKYGLDVLVPNDESRSLVHQVIYEELCLGIVREESKGHYLRIIDALAEQGAEAVILGCTEIGMLVNQADTTIPLYDTTALHAEKAVAFATESQTIENE
ncbi:MAG: aspartate/glutamate racemase family protein, partial [Pseudomonadota bacterium]